MRTMRVIALAAAAFCMAGLLAAGCAAPRERGVALTRNQARADYRDEVTGRRFSDRSNPVNVEVVRFAAVTSTHEARTLAGSASTRGITTEHAMGEALGVVPPRGMTGLRLAYAGRQVTVPTPVTGANEAVEVSRALAPGRVTAGMGPLRFESWREVLAAEARTRATAATAATGLGQLVQWPGGVHEIVSDQALASILLREDVGTEKTPIVILDFLTRFKQRPKLVLTKTADRTRALAGEKVTFTVTFVNDSPVEAHNVVIADLLDEQCDYVPDSARCDLAHTFKLEQSAEKRPVLVWRLKNPLRPRQKGTISYRVRVREAWVR